MNIKSTLAALTVAAGTLLSASAAEAVPVAIQTGTSAGFHVLAVDTPQWDTIIVPLPSNYPGVVAVRCTTGDYKHNPELPAHSARQIAKSWCRP